MEAYVTEEQQLEAIKKWFQKYGSMISWVLIIVLGTVSAVRYWFHHQDVVREQASEHYMTLLSSAEQHDETTVKSKAQILINDFSASAYATLAALALADAAVKANDFKGAQTQLEWVIHQGKQPSLQAIARVRLMRLLIAQNKLDEALGIFDENKAMGQLTLMEELKGDILVKKQNVEGARLSYEQAYSAAPLEDRHGPLLKMKIEELGGDVSAMAKKEANAKNHNNDNGAKSL